MYILYQGAVGIYADEECTHFLAKSTPNKVFGETALQNDEKRTASVKAMTKTKLLKLQKYYYKTIVLVSKQHYTKNTYRM